MNVKISLFFLTSSVMAGFDSDWFVNQGDSSKTFEVNKLPNERGPLLSWILDYFNIPSGCEYRLPSLESRQSTTHF